MKKLIMQLIRFGIVGVIAAIIDFSVLILLKEVIHLDVLLSSALAFFASVIVNYILSMLYVFKGSKDSRVKEFILFVALSTGGLMLNQFIMWSGTKIFCVYYLLVKVFACVFVTVYNFVTRKIFIEKKAS